MGWIIYETVGGLIVGGPLKHESQANVIASNLPNQAILEVTEKKIDRMKKRVDLALLELRDWTQQEIDDDANAKAAEKAAKKARKETVRDSKGQGNSVPDIVTRLDDLVAVLQDLEVIPK